MSNDTKKTCNCRDKISCPFDGECLYKGVYKTTILTRNETKEYYCFTGVSFEKIYTQQKHSFRPSINQQTTLSKYVTKNNNNKIEIIWLIINKVSNKPTEKPNMCSIRNLERMAITEANREKCLNMRNEKLMLIYL